MKPITDIAIVSRQPRWPVRLDPVAPPSLRKVRDTAPSTTKSTMEPITHMAAHPITDATPATEDIKAKPTTTFTETPELAELGATSRKEFTLARNMKDAIKPKAQEFEDLKRSAKVKMEAQRDLHLERAKNALIDARQLMRDERLGSFDAWIKSKQICGMSGKPIGRAQVYRLIDGRSAGNVDKVTGKRKPASPTGACRRQSTPEDIKDVVQDDRGPTREPQATRTLTPKDGEEFEAAWAAHLRTLTEPLEPGCCTFHDTGGSLDISCGHCDMGGPRREETAAAAPPKSANEPSGSTPGDVLLDTFHKLTPAEQVTTMQLFWDVMADWQKQQLRERVTAELPMDKLLTDRWPSMSGGEKAGVHSFVAAEMAKFETVRPAAPAISSRL
jgi:hypothetical protein